MNSEPITTRARDLLLELQAERAGRPPREGDAEAWLRRAAHNATRLSSCFASVYSRRPGTVFFRLGLTRPSVAAFMKEREAFCVRLVDFMVTQHTERGLISDRRLAMKTMRRLRLIYWALRVHTPEHAVDLILRPWSPKLEQEEVYGHREVEAPEPREPVAVSAGESALTVAQRVLGA